MEREAEREGEMEGKRERGIDFLIMFMNET